MRRTIGLRFRMFLRSVTVRLSSSLTRRIVVLNLGGLFALLVLFLYINQFREGLIDARVQSLQTQGEIIAAAIAASASVGTDSLTLDPEKLLQSTPGQVAAAPADEDSSSFEFSINPDRVGPVLRRLVSPTGTRARVYDRAGELVLDTRAMALPAEWERRNRTLAQQSNRGWFDRLWADLKDRFAHPPDPAIDEAATVPRGELPEVSDALGGDTRSIVRVTARGQTIVSMAVPIRTSKTIRGALLLSTQPGDIDKIIASDRWALFRVFMVAAVVMFALSLFLARDHRGADPAARRGSGARASRRRGARGDPRLHRPRRRDRSSVARAATDDARALFPHGGDREIRGRRRPRAQESSDLAPLRRRNPAARQDGRRPRTAQRHHPARHPPSRPADQRHFRRVAARRRTRPPSDRAVRRGGAAAGCRHGRERGRARRRREFRPHGGTPPER